MRPLRSAAALPYLLCAVHPAPAAQEPAWNELALRALPVQRIDLPAGRVASLELPVILAEEPCTLELVAQGVRAEGFQLWVSDGRGTQRVREVPPTATYAGTVREWPGARAVASLRADGLHATVLGGPGDEAWAIQPVERYDADGARLHVAYASADLMLPAAFCDVLGDRALRPAGPGGTAPLLGGVQVAELAFDADHAYFSASGATVADTLAAVEAAVHLANLFFESEVGVRHEIVGGVVRTTLAHDAAGLVSGDPYAGFQGTCYFLRTNFVTQWILHHGNVHRDVAYLFTGQSLTLPSIGCASVASLCGSDAYALSMRQDADLHTALVVAHELGHVWGACHCNENHPTNACNTYDPPGCGIMFPGNITGPPVFGAVTAATLQAHAAGFAPCLDLAGPSPAPSLAMVEPRQVQALDGGTMTLTGDELDEATYVHAGAVTLDRRHFEVLDPQTLRFGATPAAALGPATVVVQGPGGSSQPVSFEYVETTPPRLLAQSEDGYLPIGSYHTWTYAGRVGKRLEILLSFDDLTLGPPGLAVLANGTVVHSELLTAPGLGEHTSFVPFAWNGLDLWAQAVLLDGGRIVEVSAIVQHHAEL